MVELTDGSYIIVTNYNTQYFNVNKFAKYTKSGEFVWGKAFGGKTSPIDVRDAAYINSCAEGDSSYVICGGFVYGNNENDRPFFIKVSEDGEIVWTKKMVETEERGAISDMIKVTGGALFSGSSRGFNSTKTSSLSWYESILIGKITYVGEIEWINSYGGDENMMDANIYVMKENSEGNIVFIGNQYFYVDADKDTASRILFGEIDADDGSLNFIKTRGRNETQDGAGDWYYVRSIIEVNDGYLLVGRSSFEETVMRPINDCVMKWSNLPKME